MWSSTYAGGTLAVPVAVVGAAVDAVVGVDAGAEAEETDVTGGPLAVFVSPVTTTSSSLSSDVMFSPLSFATAFPFPRSALKADVILDVTLVVVSVGLITSKTCGPER
jgi:hypothetical protein